MRNVVKFLSVSTLLLSGCGSENPDSNRQNTYQNTAVNQTSLVLLPNPPTYLSYERSVQNPNVIEPVTRNLEGYQFETLVEEVLSEQRDRSLVFVTGLGIDATISRVTSSGGTEILNLPVRMGIRAREFDTSTGSFRGETRIFAAQGVNLDRAQEFAIVDAHNPNYVITGLGMSLREGTLTNLELRRTNLDGLFSSSSSGLSARNQIRLPVGWAAVGLIIAVDRYDATTPARDPFIEDVVMYTGVFDRR